jgi:hypothetical protein
MVNVPQCTICLPAAGCPGADVRTSPPELEYDQDARGSLKSLDSGETLTDDKLQSGLWLYFIHQCAGHSSHRVTRSKMQQSPCVRIRSIRLADRTGGLGTHDASQFHIKVSIM